MKVEPLPPYDDHDGWDKLVAENADRWLKRMDDRERRHNRAVLCVLGYDPDNLNELKKALLGDDYGV